MSGISQGEYHRDYGIVPGLIILCLHFARIQILCLLTCKGPHTR